MERRQWIIVGLIALVAVPAGAWYAGRPPQPPPVSVVDPASQEVPDAASAATITIHVTGEVRAPGLVTVPVGARVADAVAAAGGLTGAAAVDHVNLAASLRDGDRVVVPDRHEPPPSDGVGGTAMVAINHASVGDLASLPGIGPVTAGNIVRYRDEHGPFEVVEDLLDVPGIGEGKLAALRDRVAVP